MRDRLVQLEADLRTAGFNVSRVGVSLTVSDPLPYHMQQHKRVQLGLIAKQQLVDGPTCGD